MRLDAGVLLRIVVRPGVRTAAAAGGVAAGLLLPLMTLLALSGLDAGATEGAVGYRLDGGAFDPDGADLAVRVARIEDQRVAAYVVGAPRVEPDQAWPMAHAAGPPEALSHLELRGPPPAPLPLVPQDAVLVHPDVLAQLDVLMHPDVVAGPDVPAGRATAAWWQAAPDAGPAGVQVVAAPGREAFAVASVEGLQAAALLVAVAGLPAVALVAGLLAGMEAHAGARMAATFAALGRPRLGAWLLWLRTALALGTGAALALLFVAAAVLLGPFRPDPMPWRLLGAALAVPLVAGLLLAGLVVHRRLGDATALLRAPPGDTEAPGPRLGWLPLPARPLVLGTRVLPVLVLAALLFAVDVGLPIAAGQVPSAVGGGRDEALLGAVDDGLLGGGAPARAADALVRHDAIDEALAEVVVATLLPQGPVVLRGADWDAARDYHRLRLVDGGPPEDGIVLGRALAVRLDLDVGDLLAVPGADRPHVRHLEVRGIAAASGLLEDEAFVSLATGQDLRGLAADQASVVRARPDTLDVRVALDRKDARIEVLDLRVEPEAPPPGSAARVVLDLVNLGREAGSRPLDVRVDGLAVASLEPQVAGYGRAQAEAWFVVPPGPFVLEVNPERTVEVQAHGLRLVAPERAYADQVMRVRVADASGPLEGVPVGLHPDVRAAAQGEDEVHGAVTDADGLARLVPDATGRFVLRAGTDPFLLAHVAVVDPALRDQARIVVEDVVAGVGTVAGAPGVLEVRVRNEGGRPGVEELEVRDVRGRLMDVLEARLAAGEQDVLRASVVFVPGVNRFDVAGTEARVQAQEPAPAGEGPPPQDARSSRDVQEDLADAVLGNARRTLFALGAVAVASSLAVVFLATDRALAGRQHVLGVLHGLGLGPSALRRRAVLEAAALGAVAATAALLLAKALFLALHASGALRAFGHALPDPVDGWFFLQAVGAFAVTAAVAAHLALGRRPFGGAPEPEPLAPRPLGDLLEGRA